MIIVEIVERGRRKASRVIFNDDELADNFEAHARGRGARTARLPPKLAIEHLGALRERAARRSEWRAGSGPQSTELARRIAAARIERSREVTITLKLPRASKLELDRLAKLARQPVEALIRASVEAFIKEARR